MYDVRKISGFLVPTPPLSAFGTEFMQPPLLHLLFEYPPPPVRTSYVDGPLTYILNNVCVRLHILFADRGA